MKIYSQNKYYKLYNGNMLDMKEVIEPESVDSIVTDPPYELNFMGKGWDDSGIAFQKEAWVECFKVLKPGGYLLAFGGSRTFHRIACAIEDAGFEIRDTVMWLYGSGFPKSMALDKAIEGKLTTGNANKNNFHNLNGEQEDKQHYGFVTQNKEIGFRPKDYSVEGESTTYLKKLDPTSELAKKYKGWGTSLKPAFEPVIVARKPFKGSLVENVIKNGVGGVNIEECRVGNETHRVNINDFSNQHGNKFGNGEAIEKLGEREVTGRFPANVLFTYDDNDYAEVCGGLPSGGKNGSITKRYKMNNQVYGEFGECNTWDAYNDSGSAARYFYCAKASRRDRDEGLDALPDKFLAYSNQAQAELKRGNIEFQKDGNMGMNDVKKVKNTHPTVKPTDLMQYLVRLVTPAGGTVLDPFNGSGSTGKAVMYENKDHNKGYKYIGIEMTEEYLPIAKARIEYVISEEEPEPDKTGQLTIFDLMGV